MTDEHDHDFDASDGPLDTSFSEDLVELVWHPNDRAALGSDPRRYWPRPDAPTADFAAAAAILCKCPMCGVLHVKRDNLDVEDARPGKPIAYFTEEMLADGPAIGQRSVDEQMALQTEPAFRTIAEWEALERAGRAEIARDVKTGEFLDARDLPPDLRPIDGEVA